MKKMLHAIRSFMSNEDFHNPVTDKGKSLLSRKEKLKGRTLPHLALAGLGVVAGAATVMTAGALFVATVVLASPVYLAAALETRMRLSHRSLKKRQGLTSYDLNKAGDVANFARDFPRHKDFPGTYLTLAQKMGFSEAPVIHTIAGYDAYTTNTSLLPSGKPYVVLGRGMMKQETHEELLGTVAHELGHVQRNHGLKGSGGAVLGGLVHTFAATAAYGLLAASGMVVAIAASAVAGLAGYALSHVARAKVAQYDEREADRIALLETGMPEMGAELSRFSRRFEKKPKGLKERFRKALGGLEDRHPFSHTRGDYAAEFAKQNPEYCREKSAQYRPAAVAA